MINVFKSFFLPKQDLDESRTLGTEFKTNIIQGKQSHRSQQFQEEDVPADQECFSVKEAMNKITGESLITASKELSFQFECQGEPFSGRDCSFLLNSSISQHHHFRELQFSDISTDNRKSMVRNIEDMSTRYSSCQFPNFHDEDGIEEYEWSQQTIEGNKNQENQTQSVLQELEQPFRSFEPESQIKRSSLIPYKRKNFKEQYELRDFIGEGAFGSVYKCLHKPSQASRVVKIIRTAALANNRQMVRNKIEILRKLDHPNIIKMYQAFEWKQTLYVVMDFCQGGTLLPYMGLEGIHLAPEIKKQILRQFFKGVNYMHEVGILHRDIKPDNVLLVNKLDEHSLRSDVNVKIIDFGLSMHLKQKYSKDWKTVGSPAYMAPQVFKGVYSTKCDDWSCGVVMHLLLLGNNPFNFQNTNDILKKIQKHQLQKSNRWRSITQEEQSILKLLLQKNYLERKQLSFILNLPYFQTSKEKIYSKQKKRLCQKLVSFRRSRHLIVDICRFYLAFTKISEEQRQKISILFNLINQDNTGKISKDQFLKFFSESRRENISQLFQELDFSGSKTIDFSELICAMSNQRQLFSLGNIKEIFSLLCTKKQERFDLEELKIFLSRFSQITPASLESLFRDMDGDHDELVSEDEFVSYITKRVILCHK